MQRRNFVQYSLAASTIAAMGVSGRQALLARQPLQRPKPGAMRLSLAAYSMRKYLQIGKDGQQAMDLFQFVDFCHDLGLEGAELTSYYFPDPLPEGYMAKLKRHCHLRGVTISGGAIRNDYCQTDPAKLKADLEHTRLWIDRYAELGTTAIRIFAGNLPKGDTMEDTLKRCAVHCDAACEYAEKKGMMLALENHGGVTALADDLIRIVRQVRSENFGINFDSGNFRSMHDPYEEMVKIAPYAINAQVKVEIARNGKEEEADLPRIVKILSDVGYRGWLALEYEAKEEPKTAIPRWIEKLKALV
jgi:sugar phosphate isomerase/epimerase